MSSSIFTGETAWELMDRLSWNLLLKNFTNIYWPFQFPFRLSNFNDCITKILCVFLCISQMQVTKYLSERKLFWAEVVDKNEKHILCPVHFLRRYSFQHNWTIGMLYVHFQTAINSGILNTTAIKIGEEVFIEFGLHWNQFVLFF